MVKWVISSFLTLTDWQLPAFDNYQSRKAARSFIGDNASLRSIIKLTNEVFMSMNPGAKQPGCCGGGKKSIQQAGQQPVKQVEANDTRAQESETSSSQKPTAPQPKSKSCCG